MNTKSELDLDTLKVDISNYDKIFVTGLYSCGKTTLARSLSKIYKLRLLQYDYLVDYYAENLDAEFDFMLKKVIPNYDIFDAIPISSNNSWELFAQLEKTNNFLIIIVICYPFDSWIKRLISVRKENFLLKISKRIFRVKFLYLYPFRTIRLIYKSIKRNLRDLLTGNNSLIKLTTGNLSHNNNFTDAYIMTTHMNNYKSFLRIRKKYITDFKNVTYYDAIRGKFIDEKELQDLSFNE